MLGLKSLADPFDTERESMRVTGRPPEAGVVSASPLAGSALRKSVDLEHDSQSLGQLSAKAGVLTQSDESSTALRRLATQRSVQVGTCRERRTRG